jgi:PmbA protein
MSRSRTETEIRDLARSLVEFGRARGADEVEVGVGDSTEFSVDVRQGRIENLVEAGSRQMGVRVIKDHKTASASSSDLDPETLRGLIVRAVERAELAMPDEFAGLPPPGPREFDLEALRLYDPQVPEIDSAVKVRLALETERAALADKRITNSHGAGFGTHLTRGVLANSKGFLQSYSQTFCSLSVSLQAGGTDDRVEDFWFSSGIRYRDLAPPEEVARRAVERTVRQLRPRKVKTQSVPVVFEPLMTSWLMGFLFSCVSGTSVYQKTTFLADRLGQVIGSERVSVLDDALLPGRPGSRPFDSEGMPCGRTRVLDRGRLAHFLCNFYASRKLGLPATGNGSGGGVGPNNFFLVPGDSTPEQIIASMDKGLVLIKTIGQGLNPTTGDISRGAFGLWVEKGEIVYPVSEITIAGNLGRILQDIEMVGNDPEVQLAVGGPTIKVRELMIAGQ